MSRLQMSYVILVVAIIYKVPSWFPRTLLVILSAVLMSLPQVLILLAFVGGVYAVS